MPELSRFYGIVVQVYYGDHHLHTFMSNMPVRSQKLILKPCQ